MISGTKHCGKRENAGYTSKYALKLISCYFVIRRYNEFKSPSEYNGGLLKFVIYLQERLWIISINVNFPQGCLQKGQ